MWFCAGQGKRHSYSHAGFQISCSETSVAPGPSGEVVQQDDDVWGGPLCAGSAVPGGSEKNGPISVLGAPGRPRSLAVPLPG